MSAFDKIRAMHPDAKSVWVEFLSGWTRFTVVDEGAHIYTQINGQRVFKNEATGATLGV